MIPHPKLLLGAAKGHAQEIRLGCFDRLCRISFFLICQFSEGWAKGAGYLDTWKSGFHFLNQTVGYSRAITQKK
jgi:hypothetical protein